MFGSNENNHLRGYYAELKFKNLEISLKKKIESFETLDMFGSNRNNHLH